MNNQTMIVVLVVLGSLFAIWFFKKQISIVPRPPGVVSPIDFPGGSI